MDVYKRILKLKPRSTTPTDLPIKIYKEFAPELAPPLCSIINASLSQYSCPVDWKSSFVTPISKTPSLESLNDLRPVAITPIPSLICEDFVFDWAYNISNSLDIQQFGNIRATSTSHYLISFLDFIHSHLDKRNTSLAVAFVDFRKAFDLVDHTRGSATFSPLPPLALSTPPVTTTFSYPRELLEPIAIKIAPYPPWYEQ
ncbi:uncharacterized protein LOC123506629 [Portunus trituberculatus]|uniref:uncharacterized protein LOC123506629 n=1 Tax=Portunus trituberculatus TaxID=210409 RepID=UPI001E1CB9C0|nr:uncharacterized protein LOC123506629 [Portunus trituberculatus]